MYFKVSGRHNPHTGKNDWYYRLVESYRNSDGRVCHRTMLNVGFLEADGVSTEQMNKIKKLIQRVRVEQAQTQKILFDTPLNKSPLVKPTF